MGALVAVIFFTGFIKLTISANTKPVVDKCDQTEKQYLNRIFDQINPANYTKQKFNLDVCSNPVKKFNWTKEQLDNLLTTDFNALKTKYSFKIDDLTKVLTIGSEMANTQFLRMIDKYDTTKGGLYKKPALQFSEILQMLCQTEDIDEPKIKLLFRLMKDNPESYYINVFLFDEVRDFLVAAKEIEEDKKYADYTKDDYRKIWNCASTIIDSLYSVPQWSINSSGTAKFVLFNLKSLIGPGVTCEEISKNITEVTKANEAMNALFFGKILGDIVDPICLTEEDFKPITSSSSGNSSSSPSSTPSGGQQTPAEGHPTGPEVHIHSSSETQEASGKPHNSSDHAEQPSSELKPESEGQKNSSTETPKAPGGQHKSSEDNKQPSQVTKEPSKDKEHSSEDLDKSGAQNSSSVETQPPAIEPQHPSAGEPQQPPAGEQGSSTDNKTSKEDSLKKLKDVNNFLDTKKLQIFKTVFNCLKRTGDLCQEVSQNTHKIFAKFAEYNENNLPLWKTIACWNIMSRKFYKNPVIKFSTGSKTIEINDCNYDLSTKEKVLNTISTECGLGIVDDFSKWITVLTKIG